MNALMWSVANRTEGVIEPGDLKDIRDFDRAQIKTLIAVELWESRGPNSGWLIIDFPTTQTGRDLLKKYEKEKALDRARKARARNAKIAEELAELAGERSSGGSSGGKIPAESPRPDKTKPAQTGNRGTAGKKTIPANSTEPTSTCAGTAAAARRSGGRPRVGTTCRCAGRATTPALSTSPMRSGHDAPSSGDSFRRKDGVTPRTTLEPEPSLPLRLSHQ
jgi:hypothetical protein